MATITRQRANKPIIRARTSPPYGAGRPHVLAAKRKQNAKADPNYNEADVRTRFQLGNDLWANRITCGRPKNYDTPEEFLDAFKEALIWNCNNPLYEAKFVTNQGISTLDYLPKVRVLTLFFVQTFMGLTPARWCQLKTSRSDLLPLIEMIEGIVKDKKFTHAAAGQLNATVIMRDLGLADTINNNNKDIPSQSSDDNAKINLDRLRSLHTEGQQ